MIKEYRGKGSLILGLEYRYLALYLQKKLTKQEMLGLSLRWLFGIMQNVKERGSRSMLVVYNTYMKKSIVIFYIFFIVSGALSLVYVPNVFSYPYLSELSICIILLPSFLGLRKAFGLKKALLIIGTIGLYALSIEYIGLVTGMPYGAFTYNPELGGRIGGILPWTVSLSYTTLLLGSIGIAYTLTDKKVFRILLTVLILLVSDLVLDPGAVAIGMWSFTDWGYYYGVPIQNFIGWIITGIPAACLGYFLLSSVNKKQIFPITYSFFISISMWVCIALFEMLWIPFFLGVGLMSLQLVLYLMYAKNISTQST
jgi:putative membrane protein